MSICYTGECKYLMRSCLLGSIQYPLFYSPFYDVSINGLMYKFISMEGTNMNLHVRKNERKGKNKTTFTLVRLVVKRIGKGIRVKHGRNLFKKFINMFYSDRMNIQNA